MAQLHNLSLRRPSHCSLLQTVRSLASLPLLVVLLFLQASLRSTHILRASSSSAGPRAMRTWSAGAP